MQAILLKTIQALEEARVRYLIVGGVAVVLHGHLRTTVDLDVVLELAPANVQKALAALDEAGFQPTVPENLSSFGDPEARQNWRQEKNMIVFSLWHEDDPLFRLDLFLEEPFEDFEGAYEGRLEVDLGGFVGSVISREDLMRMKRESGRPQDLADLEALRNMEET